MTTATSLSAPRLTTPMPTDWRDFWALTKPRVMSLVVFTGLCGLLAAPVPINPVLGFTAILCIALGAGGAAALNQWWEVRLDAGMKRTARRPLPAGRMEPASARDFGVALSATSVVVMALAIGWLAAGILALSIAYYVGIYTVWLKPRTPQNIVIGGAAGAFPPLIGWVAATGHLTLMPVLLFAIIFFWTPPHFWALALFVESDYAKVGIPMLPVVAGEGATRRQIMAYALLLAPLSLAPCLLPAGEGGVGAVYGGVAALASALFVALALRVGLRRKQGADDAMTPEKQLFAFSILFLFALFAALVADHWLHMAGMMTGQMTGISHG